MTSLIATHLKCLIVLLKSRSGVHHHITYMYIYRHIKIHQTILYRIIRDYIHLKIHRNYHSWTKYDNKKGSVIFSKWKQNAIEITNYMYLQRTQNWHPESGHKWLGITPTYKRPRPRVTAHAMLWNFSLFPFLSHTTHASPQKQHSQAQRICGGNRCPDSMPPCADDCAP